MSPITRIAALCFLLPLASTASEKLKCFSSYDFIDSEGNVQSAPWTLRYEEAIDTASGYAGAIWKDFGLVWSAHLLLAQGDQAILSLDDPEGITGTEGFLGIAGGELRSDPAASVAPGIQLVLPLRELEISQGKATFLKADCRRCEDGLPQPQRGCE
jgi:hypothetical protein